MPSGIDLILKPPTKRKGAGPDHGRRFLQLMPSGIDLTQKPLTKKTKKVAGGEGDHLDIALLPNTILERGDLVEHGDQLLLYLRYYLRYVDFGGARHCGAEGGG